MLKQRVVTALILAPLALFAILFLPLQGFEIVVAGIMALGAWEWANLMGLTHALAKSVYTALVAGLCLLLSFFIPVADIWHQGTLNPVYLWILEVAALWWLMSLA